MFDYVDNSDMGVSVDLEKGTISYTGEYGTIINLNKRYALEEGDGFSKSRELKHVARIPPFIYYKWLAEEGIDALNPEHGGAVRRKLNSSEYAYLRTGKGQVGKGAYD